MALMSPSFFRSYFVDAVFVAAFCFDIMILCVFLSESFVSRLAEVSGEFITCNFDFFEFKILSPLELFECNGFRLFVCIFPFDIYLV